jgi:FixJ family two-component response regulator
VFIAIVNDDPCSRHLWSHVLRRTGFEVGCYVDGQDFLDRYTPRPGCVVLNMVMPTLDGLETLAAMRAKGWTVPVIAESTDPDYGPLALARGAVLFLRSASPQALVQAVTEMLDRHGALPQPDVIVAEGAP